MNQILLLSGVVIILSVFLHKLSMKMGVPVLLAFLLLGIVFGIDGVFKIHFENFELSDYLRNNHYRFNSYLLTIFIN